MNKDKILSSSQFNDIQFQCSQALHTVNTNVTVSQLLNQKPKKMSSNKRRRQKLKRRKQQSRIALHEIIKNMCSLKTNFEQNMKTIEVLLQVDLDEDRFYEFISKVTREQMDILAKQIHGLTGNFCKLYREDKAIDPAQIARLYEYISKVRQASVQIQKVINFFIKKSEQGDTDGYMHQNLQFSTLKYVVESDPLKEDFEHFCHTFILQSKDQRQKLLIQQIINIFKAALQFQQQPQQCLQCYQQLQIKHQNQNQYEQDLQNDNQQQQEHSKIEQMETMHTQASQQNKKKKKKKKNKSKNAQDIKVQSIYKEIQMYNNVIRNLSELQIQDGARTSCYIDESWLFKLKTKLGKQKWLENKR